MVFRDEFLALLQLCYVRLDLVCLAGFYSFDEFDVFVAFRKEDVVPRGAFVFCPGDLERSRSLSSEFGEKRIFYRRFRFRLRLGNLFPLRVKPEILCELNLIPWRVCGAGAVSFSVPPVNS